MTCAVAVMHIEIDDGNLFHFVCLQSVQSSDSHRVEDAEPTRNSAVNQPVDSSMVSWRPDHTECPSVLSCQPSVDGIYDSTSCSQSSFS